MRNRFVIFLILAISCMCGNAQENGYFNKNDVKGFMPLVKQLAAYEKADEVMQSLNIQITDTLYNKLFYKSHYGDHSTDNRARFVKLDVVSFRPILIKSSFFTDYIFVLNPDLEAETFSKFRTTLQLRPDKSIARMATPAIEIKIPKRIAYLENEDDLKLRMEFNNELQYNNINGFKAIQITEASIPDFKLTHSPIAISNAEKGIIEFAQKENFNHVIQEGVLTNFLNLYHKNIGSPKDYMNAIYMKEMEATITINGHKHRGELQHLYFIKDFVAGVIKFKHDDTFITDIHYYRNDNQKPEYTPREIFNVIAGSNNSTYFKLTQDYRYYYYHFVVIP